MISSMEDSPMAESTPKIRSKPAHSDAYETAKARLAARGLNFRPDLSAAYEAEMAMDSSAFACKSSARKKSPSVQAKK